MIEEKLENGNDELENIIDDDDDSKGDISDDDSKNDESNASKQYITI